MSTKVHKYGDPTQSFESDDDGCPCCDMFAECLGPVEAGTVLFVELDEDWKSDEHFWPKGTIRRVEKMGSFLGMRMLSCVTVTKEKADAEIAEFQPS